MFREKLAAVLNGNLEKENAESISLLQLRLVESAGPSDRLLASLNRCAGDGSSSTVVPLLGFLIRRPKVELAAPALTSLYRLAGDSNRLLALHALTCLSLLTEEGEWLRKSVITILKSAGLPQRVSMVKILLKAWETAIAHEEVRGFFWDLFVELLVRFGETIDSSAMINVVHKIVEIGEVDEFLKAATRVLERIPSTETIMLLIFCAREVRENASRDALSEFLNVLQPTINVADLLLRSFYHTTFNI
jgi:hypothetical protein